MKNIKFIFAGIVFTLSSSFLGILLSGRVQLGSLGRAPAEEGGVLFPSREPGLAIQGRDVYLSLGCVACHTQQVRPASQGNDIAKGYGPRHSVARDYVLQSTVILGSHRIGPDLANYGARVTNEGQIHQDLLNPKAGSAMPSYAFLYTKGKDGTLVPTEKATALVAYLKSLKIDYSSPEAKLNQ